MSSYVVAALLTGLSTYLGVQAVTALRSGRMTALVPVGPYRGYSRWSNPGSFWIVLTCTSCLQALHSFSPSLRFAAEGPAPRREGIGDATGSESNAD